jgi:hypothetical protein
MMSRGTAWLVDRDAPSGLFRAGILRPRVGVSNGTKVPVLYAMGKHLGLRI